VGVDDDREKRGLRVWISLVNDTRACNETKEGASVWVGVAQMAGWERGGVTRWHHSIARECNVQV
jgi:hypothetical protein